MGVPAQATDWLKYLKVRLPGFGPKLVPVTVNSCIKLAEGGSMSKISSLVGRGVGKGVEVGVAEGLGVRLGFGVLEGKGKGLKEGKGLRILEGKPAAKAMFVLKTNNTRAQRTIEIFFIAYRAGETEVRMIKTHSRQKINNIKQDQDSYSQAQLF